jgi:hypothetical protein
LICVKTDKINALAANLILKLPPDGKGGVGMPFVVLGRAA